MNKTKILTIITCTVLSFGSLTACSENHKEQAEQAFTTTTETTETTVASTINTTASARNKNDLSKKEEALFITKDFFSGDRFSSKSDYLSYMKGKGYTDSEINYCLKQCNVDWNEQAEGQARAYLESASSDLTSEELKNMLKNVGYTDFQINYALNAIENDKDISYEDTPTSNEQNALREASQYLSTSQHFSKSELKNQLKYEGYTDAESEYAVNNCNADWNEQAAGSAQDYINILSLSRDELMEQLEYDGFTNSQISYALSAVGY